LERRPAVAGSKTQQAVEEDIHLSSTGSGGGGFSFAPPQVCMLQWLLSSSVCNTCSVSRQVCQEILSDHDVNSFTKGMYQKHSSTNAVFGLLSWWQHVITHAILSKSSSCWAIGCRATLHLEVAKGDMADDLLVKVWQIHHAVVIIPHQTLNAKAGGVS
jgi:hypothetical protein